MKKISQKIYIVVVPIIAAMGLWFAAFHTTGHVRVMMLVHVFLLVVSIPLSLFIWKREREGKKPVGIFSRQYKKSDVPALIIGATVGALLWWLAFGFLPHNHG